MPTNVQIGIGTKGLLRILPGFCGNGAPMRMKPLPFLLLFPLLSCSTVNVKKTGNQTYSLKCSYSRAKCEDRVLKVCKDEGKVSNVLMRKESVGVSWAFWPIGLLTTDRPVTHLLVECVEPKPAIHGQSQIHHPGQQ